MYYFPQSEINKRKLVNNTAALILSLWWRHQQGRDNCGTLPVITANKPFIFQQPQFQFTGLFLVVVISKLIAAVFLFVCILLMCLWLAANPFAITHNGLAAACWVSVDIQLHVATSQVSLLSPPDRDCRQQQSASWHQQQQQSTISMLTTSFVCGCWKETTRLQLFQYASRFAKYTVDNGRWVAINLPLLVVNKVERPRRCVPSLRWRHLETGSLIVALRLALTN